MSGCCGGVLACHSGGGGKFGHAGEGLAAQVNTLILQQPGALALKRGVLWELCRQHPDYEPVGQPALGHNLRGDGGSKILPVRSTL